VARLVSSLPPVDAIIAVGSGTLNDLVKMVALERGIPQLVFATAPSMNGYTSVSASIMTDGIKRSYRTRTPVAAFFDLGVIAAAPMRLIRAGLGDSLCRATAQADWLLSHLLLGRPYREAPFALLAADEQALFAEVPALIAGDASAMRHLVRTLVLSGFGMTIAGGSFPASQGEHLISHYLEMMRPDGVELGYHGEQIGVCTLEMARLQHSMLALDTPPALKPGSFSRDQLVGHYGPAIGESCWLECQGKLFTAAQADALNARLATEWDTIRTRIARIAVAPEILTRVLVGAGAATLPGDLEIPADLFADARRHAREIRNRYTFLDLEADLA
jgi:glycerol-1-phosphate dehydrogenase [NAD(P)+]